MPRLHHRTWADAEREVAEWLRRNGFDVRFTSKGADGGVDLTGSDLVVQVKTQRLPVGAPAIQALFGVAVADRKTAVFFALAGYTPQARGFAERAGVALFALDDAADPRPANQPARDLLAGRRAREEASEEGVVVQAIAARIEELLAGEKGTHLTFTFGDYLAYSIRANGTPPLPPTVDLEVSVAWRAGHWPVPIAHVVDIAVLSTWSRVRRSYAKGLLSDDVSLGVVTGVTFVRSAHDLREAARHLAAAVPDLMAAIQPPAGAAEEEGQGQDLDETEHAALEFALARLPGAPGWVVLDESMPDEFVGFPWTSQGWDALVEGLAALRPQCWTAVDAGDFVVGRNAGGESWQAIAIDSARWAWRVTESFFMSTFSCARAVGWDQAGDNPVPWLARSRVVRAPMTPPLPATTVPCGPVTTLDRRRSATPPPPAPLRVPATGPTLFSEFAATSPSAHTLKLRGGVLVSEEPSHASDDSADAHESVWVTRGIELSTGAVLWEKPGNLHVVCHNTIVEGRQGDRGAVALTAFDLVSGAACWTWENVASLVGLDSPTSRTDLVVGVREGDVFGVISGDGSMSWRTRLELNPGEGIGLGEIAGTVCVNANGRRAWLDPVNGSPLANAPPHTHLVGPYEIVDFGEGVAVLDEAGRWKWSPPPGCRLMSIDQEAVVFGSSPPLTGSAEVVGYAPTGSLRWHKFVDARNGQWFDRSPVMDRPVVVVEDGQLRQLDAHSGEPTWSVALPPKAEGGLSRQIAALGSGWWAVTDSSSIAVVG